LSGAAIEVTVDDREVADLLERIQKNLGDLTPAMKIIGAIGRTSVIRNFEKSGRPKNGKSIPKPRKSAGAKGPKF